tara:strand:+ start:2220 stop:2381 length:162 start_codon:yes stop_codon:yes gene_type:complete
MVVQRVMGDVMGRVMGDVMGRVMGDVMKRVLGGYVNCTTHHMSQWRQQVLASQ